MINRYIRYFPLPLRAGTLYRQCTIIAVVCLMAIVFFNLIALIRHAPRAMQAIQDSTISATVILISLLFYVISFLQFVLFFIKGSKIVAVSNFSFYMLRLYIILFFSFTIVFHFCIRSLTIPGITARHLGLSSFLLITSLLFIVFIRYPISKLNKKAFSVAEYIVFQIALIAILAELLLAVWVRFTDSPLAVNLGYAGKGTIFFRGEPGELFFGFPFNSLGFHDEEFSSTNDKRFVVNALSDSFGVGIVPFRHNFLTIAERSLSNKFSNNEIFVNNFSAGAISIPGYLDFYNNEARRFPCDLTILCTFVGNDLEDIQRTNVVKNVWNFSHWRLPNIIRNIYTLKHLSRNENNLLSIGKEASAPPLNSSESIMSSSPDEIPHMNETEFIAVEQKRFVQICLKNSKVDENYKYYLNWLKLFKNFQRENILVVIIPDEFQVNDSLYAQITQQMDHSKIDRYMPQKRILAFCREEQIACLDLLPVLSEAEKTGHCYHLRDTHWNSKGNYYAGEKIAQVLAEEIKKVKGWRTL